MAYKFTLVVQETKPINYIPGSFWLKASVGLLMINIGEEYHHIAAGNGNLVLVDGIYYRTVTESTTAPVAPTVGDIWLQNNNTYWAYLGKWTPFGGG